MNVDNMDFLLEVKSKSIGKEKKEKLKIYTKEISKKAFIFLMTLCLSICICSCKNVKVENDLSVNYSYVDMYGMETDATLKKILHENNMSDYNTIEQYENIKQYLNEDDMILYYDKLGSSECEKICIVFGYEGFDDYLLKNGYIDSQGNPSKSVLRSSTEIRITEEMSEKINRSK